MPEFADVASHFDQEPVSDGYTGLGLFSAQFGTFDDAARDGNVSKRRVMSVRAGTAIPARRAIAAGAETFLVGEGNNELFMGQVVRTTYWLKKTTNTVSILTPGQVLSGAAGVTALAHVEYLKDTVQSSTDADYYPVWDFYLSTSETVERGTFFKIGSTLYRARAKHLELSGHLLAVSDQMESTSFVTVSLPDSGIYDPVSDTYSGTSATSNGILVDSSKLYKLRTDADAKVHSGDNTLITATALTVGRSLLIAGVKYQVILSNPERDAFAHRIRRQG